MTVDPYASYTRLRFEHPADGVLLIVLDNPAALNATDAEMHRELPTIFRTVDNDDSVRAVVVTGEGTAFSAGGDLDWIAEQVGDYAQTMRVMREAGDIVRTMIECDTPIVSAINGVAVTGGFGESTSRGDSRSCRSVPAARRGTDASEDGGGKVVGRPALRAVRCSAR